MEDKLRLNTKLFDGFNGKIGRRDYFINSVFISIISFVFVLVYALWLFYGLSSSTPDMLYNMFSFTTYPVFIKIWIILGIFIFLVLSVSNNCRRINDLFDKASKSIIFLNILFTFFVILPFISFFCNFWDIDLYTYIALGIWFLLLFSKGKISTDYEKIEEKNLNKDNEKQTIKFICFANKIIPIVYVVLIAVSLFVMVNFIKFGVKSYPLSFNYPENEIPQNFEEILSLYYDSYEITDKENKFYASSKDWDRRKINEKMRLLYDLSALSAKIRTDESKAKNSANYKVFTKDIEIYRTNVYDKETGRKLSGFII